MPQKKQPVRQPPITRKERRLLEIMARHGWCTMETLRRFADSYGIPAQGNSIADAIRRLQRSGYIRDVAARDGRKTRAYAPNILRIGLLKHAGVPINADMKSAYSSRSLRRTLAINQMMIELNKELAANCWISTPSFLTQNASLTGAKFAPDYDAISEFLLPNGGATRVGFIVSAM
jgi:hypothetical protein